MAKQLKLLVPSPAAPAIPHVEKGRELGVEDQKRTRRSWGEKRQRALNWGTGRGQSVRTRTATRRQGGLGWSSGLRATPGPKEDPPELKRESRQEAVLGMHWTL